MDKTAEQITKIFKQNESIFPVEGHGVKVLRRVNYPKVIEEIKTLFGKKKTKKDGTK